MSVKFRLVYPENRIVSSDTIETWYDDALANGEVEIDVDFREALDVESKADALDDAGLITIAEVIYDE